MYFARQMDKGLIEIGWRSDTATSDWQSQTIIFFLKCAYQIQDI